MGESAPFWRFSAASYPDLEQAMAVDAVLRTAKRKPSKVSETSYGVCYLAKPYMQYESTVAQIPPLTLSWRTLSADTSDYELGYRTSLLCKIF